MAGTALQDRGKQAGHGPRGRPRGFDRTAALDAAMALFWRRGFTATSIADLCAAMGIASPSLYAAFGSKEALYAEALARYVDRAVPAIWAPLEAASTARAGLEAFLLASAATLPARPGKPAGCMVALAAVGDEGCPDLGRRVAEARADAFARLVARITQGLAAGELPPGTDCAALARFYLAVQQGMSSLARDGATATELEAVARRAMEAWPARATAATSARA